MQFSLLSIIYLIAFSHALLVSVVMIRKSERNQPGILLAIMLLFFAYKLFEGAVEYSDLYRHIPHTLYWLPGVVLFMGPLFYAYVCRMSAEKVWSIKQWSLHLLPAVLVFLWYSPQLFVSGEQKIRGLEYFQSLEGPIQIPTPIVFLLVSWKIHLATYLILSWKKLKQVESLSLQQFSDDSVFTITWQKRLCLMLMALELLWIVLVVAEQFVGFTALDYVSKIWLLFMASIVLVMGYWGLQQPDLIVSAIIIPSKAEHVTHNQVESNAENNPTPSVELEVEKNSVEIFATEVEHNVSEKKNSATPLVDEVTAKSIAKEIEKQMVENQLYLKLGLKLNELSDELGIRTHIVSEVINQTMNTTFFNLINGYRVDHAKSLLNDPNQFRTLEQISVESGFNNRVTFNKAFKLVEGMTPSAYRKTQRMAS